MSVRAVATAKQGLHLLHSCNELGEVVHRDLLVKCQAVALSLHTGPGDRGKTEMQDEGVELQCWRSESACERFQHHECTSSVNHIQAACRHDNAVQSQSQCRQLCSTEVPARVLARELNRRAGERRLAAQCHLLIRTRASAVKPAKAKQMWSSILTILRTVLASCSLAADFFSTPAGRATSRQQNTHFTWPAYLSSPL